MKNYPGPRMGESGEAERDWAERLAGLHQALSEAGQLFLLTALPKTTEARKSVLAAMRLAGEGNLDGAAQIIGSAEPLSDHEAALANELVKLLPEAILAVLIPPPTPEAVIPAVRDFRRALIARPPQRKEIETGWSKLADLLLPTRNARDCVAPVVGLSEEANYKLADLMQTCAVWTAPTDDPTVRGQMIDRAEEFLVLAGDHSPPHPDYPLVGLRTSRRPPLRELSQGPRERQALYCIGFPPDWWLGFDCADRWKGFDFPLEASVEAVRQCRALMRAMRLEFTIMGDDGTRKAELEAEERHNLDLIRQSHPGLLTAPEDEQRSPKKRPPPSLLRTISGPSRAGRGLELMSQRIETAAVRFPDCFHFLVKAEHPDWPWIPDRRDPEYVQLGLSVSLVGEIADIAFELQGGYSSDRERRERFFLDLAWIEHGGAIYQAFLMDRHGGKVSERMRMLQEAKEWYEREADQAAGLFLGLAQFREQFFESPLRRNRSDRWLETTFHTLPTETRRVAVRASDGRVYDGDDTFRSTDDAYTVIIPCPADLFAAFVCAVELMSQTRQDNESLAAPPTAVTAAGLAIGQVAESVGVSPPQENTPRATPIPATPNVHPDGPDGGRWVWFANKRHPAPRGVVYRLLAHMWGRDSASYDDLEKAGVFESAVAPQTVRSYANKANNALPTGVPWRLSTDSLSRQLTKVPDAPGA